LSISTPALASTPTMQTSTITMRAFIDPVYASHTSRPGSPGRPEAPPPKPAERRLMP
jgi:hypothetical protein